MKKKQNWYSVSTKPVVLVHCLFCCNLNTIVSKLPSSFLGIRTYHSARTAQEVPFTYLVYIILNYNEE